MPQETWKKSRIPNLFIKLPSGVYYAKVKVQGKLKKRSLKTDDYNRAAKVLVHVLEDLRGRPLDFAPAGSFKACLDAAKDRTDDDPKLAESTATYYGKCHGRIMKKCPNEILSLSLENITEQHLERMVAALAAAYAPSVVNGAISFANKFVFKHAKQAGQIRENPLAEIDRIPIRNTQKEFPTGAEFAEIVAEVRNNKLRLDARGRCTGYKHAEISALAIEFLAYSGLRISEAKALTWGSVKEDALRARTAKSRTGRNGGLGRIRVVPIGEKLAEVLAALRAAPGSSTRATDPVFPLESSPRKALINACKRLGISPLCVHDLRHVFITRCLESGVPVPTVAAWAGHSDGGNLILRTYSHVIPDHSAQQMQKVAF